MKIRTVRSTAWTLIALFVLAVLITDLVCFFNAKDFAANRAEARLRTTSS